MKIATHSLRIFALFFAVLMMLSFAASAQITLTAQNTPLKATAFTFDSLGITGLPAPDTGANRTWDYSNTTVALSNSEQLASAANVSATALYDTLGFDPLAYSGGQIYGVYYDVIFDEHNSPIESVITDPGIYFPEQAFNVGAVSLNPTDSLWVPQQTDYYTTPDSSELSPITYIQFPLNAGEEWTSSGTRRENMVVRIGLVNEGEQLPDSTKLSFQKISTFNTSDSVAGWGTLSVPGASNVPALMVKVKENRVDSFYLNGAVPPLIILERFGDAEGHDTNYYSYQFFRVGSILPLLFIEYSDSTYKTPSEAYSYQAASSGVAESANIASGMQIYPNPARTKSFFIHLNNGVSGGKVELMDATGKPVPIAQQFSAMNGTQFTILLAPEVANGTYFIRVVDADGQTVQQSKVEVAE